MLKLEKFIRQKSGKAKSDSMGRIISLKADEFSRKSERVASMISDAIVNSCIIYVKIIKYSILASEIILKCLYCLLSRQV